MGYTVHGVAKSRTRLSGFTHSVLLIIFNFINKNAMKISVNKPYMYRFSHALPINFKKCKKKKKTGDFKTFKSVKLLKKVQN